MNDNWKPAVKNLFNLYVIACCVILLAFMIEQGARIDTVEALQRQIYDLRRDREDQRQKDNDLQNTRILEFDKKLQDFKESIMPSAFKGGKGENGAVTTLSR